MIRWLLHLGIRSVERKTNYDASYMHDVVDTSTSAGLKLSLLPLLSQHREDAPKPLWFGAGFASVLEGDCGPCVQLMVDQGISEGVDPDLLRAILARDFDTMGEEAALGFRFAEAVIADDTDSEAYRIEIEHRYGKRAMIALAYATAFCRTYPVLKRGLGHGLACQKIKVGDQLETVIRKAA
jgi:hypothetical protein